MTLPASGAISINAINIELGRSGTAQSSLNETALRTLAGVPSGQIDFNDFWGKSNSPVYLPPTNGIYGYDIGSSAADCSLDVLAAGTWLCYGNDWDSTGTWLLSGSASSYDARLTQNSLTGSGTFSTGLALATWYNLGSNRTWILSCGSGNISEFDGVLEIRLASSPFTILASGTVYMGVDTV